MHYTRWRAGVRLLQQGFRATSLAEYQQHVALNATAQSTLCQRAWLHSTVTALDSTKDDASRGKNDKPTGILDHTAVMYTTQMHKHRGQHRCHHTHPTQIQPANQSWI